MIKSKRITKTVVLKVGEKPHYCGVSYRAKDRQWVITEEYVSGYVILARFDTSAEAFDALKEMQS